MEATNVGDLDELDELVVEDFVEHEPIPGQPQGREGLKWAYRQFLDPFPDVKFIFDDVIGEGDLVIGRGVISATHAGPFFGIPATNKKVHWTGTRLFRMRDLKMTEGWVNIDMLTLDAADGRRARRRPVPIRARCRRRRTSPGRRRRGKPTRS